MDHNFTFFIVLLLSIVVIGFGLVTIFKILFLKKNGNEVSGTITALKNNLGIDNKTIQPEVTFTTNSGVTITSLSNLSFIPGYYRVGKKVSVIYNESKPNDFIVNDKATYLTPLFMIFLGVIILFFISN